MRTSPPLIAPLFRSEGQARVLSELFLSDEEVSLTELAERADLAYATVHREVDRLLDASLLAERQVGRARLVRADPTSPLYAPLLEILLIATGPVPLLAAELAQIDGVEAAFLFGSFAARMHGEEGEAPKDIDVMIIGEPDPERVYDACQRVEEAVRRPVNPVITAKSAFDDDSGFHREVRARPIVPILGDAPWW